MKRMWPRLIQWVVVLALPVLMVTISLRVTTGDWFVAWEYGKESFPPDPFGLTIEDRVRMTGVSVEYLATNADITLLSDLRLPDGSPAFNERELQHMADVQVRYHQLIVSGVIAGAVVAAGIALLLVPGSARRYVPGALIGGSGLTLGLLAGVGACMLLAWETFFERFHRLFFTGDTWLFDYSDTLIRLTPMRFWIDVAVVIVTLLVAQVLVVGGVGWVCRRRLSLSE